MKILILTASQFYGGPERQMIELAKTLRVRYPDVVCCLGSFPEEGNCRPFIEKVTTEGFEAIELVNDFPHLIRARNELKQVLIDRKIDILIANGYKARGVSCMLPKSLRIPILTVSRGWTTENLKIRFFNLIDRWFHRLADHVIAVSDGQAAKVIRFGTPPERVMVIHNAIRTERFDVPPDPLLREKLLAMFPNTTANDITNDHSQSKPLFLLGAAGRLSPEKGFDLLINAVKIIHDRAFPIGLVIFGEGFLREVLEEQVKSLGLQDCVQLPGFTDELDRVLPHFDIFVQSSHTEGLPNVLLESMAARTPVVATNVGGTPEVVEEGVTGLMVPPNNAEQLADAICRLLAEPEKLPVMGTAARERVQTLFTFENQADRYYELLCKFCARGER
jgi:glycosyltransferase involved in cell wall biosynthesis